MGAVLFTSPERLRFSQLTGDGTCFTYIILFATVPIVYLVSSSLSCTLLLRNRQSGDIFRYTRELVIQSAYWKRYVLYVGVMFATVPFVYLVLSSLSRTLLLRTQQDGYIFQNTREVVIPSAHWRRYVLYIHNIVCYCAYGLSGVVLSFMYSITKDPT